MYDAIVAGSGFSGATTAHILADRYRKRVLLLEKRSHIGGNMYDEPDENGIYVHRYGPHIFHTALPEAFDFLKPFTEWRSYEHRVLGFIDGIYVPIPFNFTSIDRLFSKDRAARFKSALTASFPGRPKVSVLELIDTENDTIRELGGFVFDKVFKNYTAKQWGTPPAALDRDVINRVPVVLSYDDRYFDDPIQFMPVNGYTSIFRRMLSHPLIDTKLNCDATSRLKIDVDAGIILFDGQPYSGPVIYTSPLDELFGFCFGELSFRSLDMVFEHIERKQFQAAAVVNYPNDELFTRITEFKYLTGQQAASTTVMKEYPLPCDRRAARGNIPYYPIPDVSCQSLYNQYKNAAARIKNLYPCGRLAEYKYYNMDKAILQAMHIAEAAADDQKNH